MQARMFLDWVSNRDEKLLENMKKQMQDVQGALMSLKFLAPQGISDMSVTKLGDLLDKEEKVPEDISPIRFAAMIKSMARGATRVPNRPDLYDD